MAGIAAFLRVAERASFSMAADDLGVARATIGMQVRMLERRLGVRLLHRSTRAVSLTEAGAAYRDAIAHLPAQVREAERAAASFQTEAVGRIRIAAPPDLGPAHIAPVLVRYMADHPAVSIELTLSTDTTDLVGEGYDLAIRGALTVEPTLVTRQIGRSPIVACAAPAYLDRHGSPQTPYDLQNHACLHFAGLRWGRAWLFQRAGEVARVAIVPRLECNDGPTLLAAAVDGAGIALEPMFVVGPAIRAGRLIPVLTDWALPEIPIHAVYPANRHIAGKVRTLVDRLASAFAAAADLS
ncbi:MAG: LysR substrate-binding domain-containing protein [Sphingomonas fennica]